MGNGKDQTDLEIQEALNDENLPMVVRGISVDQIALMEPAKAAAVVQNRIEALKTIRKAAIKATNPEDWVGFKDGDGNVNYILRSSGAANVRKAYGISSIRVRPEQPKIETIGDRTTATIIGDGYCSLTGEMVTNIVGCRASDEHFVGRNTTEDLRQAARTSLETKIVRILAGMVRVPERELTACGLEVAKMGKGSGFGTSAERKTDKIVDDKTKKLRKELGDKLLKYTAGDEGKAANVLKEITANPPKFDGFNKLSALTLDWQVKSALEKLEVLMSEGGKS